MPARTYAVKGASLATASFVGRYDRAVQIGEEHDPYVIEPLEDPVPRKNPERPDETARPKPEEEPVRA